MAVAAHISFVPVMRIGYIREIGSDKETVDVAPEEEQHAIRAMSAHVSSMII